MRPPPSRKRIRIAIFLTIKDRGKSVIPDEYLEDGTYILISFIDVRREKREAEGVDYDLKQLTRETLEVAQLDPGKRRAYELIIMRYYSLTAQVSRRSRRT